MVRNKSPQTFQKRMRERDRQMIQRAKLAKRLERKAAKRQEKADGVSKTEVPSPVVSPGTPSPGIPSPATPIPEGPALHMPKDQ